MGRSVLEGRRLKFTKTDREEKYPSLGPEYEVAAVADRATARPPWILLGYIEATTVSTDRHYGRIRSPGKGRRAWYAKVPRDQQIGTHAYLIGHHTSGFYLAHTSGVTYETREEAARDLVLYRDHPAKRRGIDLPPDDERVLAALARAGADVVATSTNEVRDRASMGKQRALHALRHLDRLCVVDEEKRGRWRLREGGATEFARMLARRDDGE